MGDLVRRIAALKPFLGTIEQRRRDRVVAFLGEPIADRADMMIDAKDFLNNDDAALGRAFGIGAIRSQLVLVVRGEGEMLTQVDLLLHDAAGSFEMPQPERTIYAGGKIEAIRCGQQVAARSA